MDIPNTLGVLRSTAIILFWPSLQDNKTSIELTWFALNLSLIPEIISAFGNNIFRPIVRKTKCDAGVAGCGFNQGRHEMASCSFDVAGGLPSSDATRLKRGNM